MKLLGNKKNEKLYRYHTGFPGGLKTTKYKDKLERDPTFPVYNAVKGMLAKNISRRIFLSNMVLHEGPYHRQDNWGLPQFIEQPELDLNHLLPANSPQELDANEFKIVKVIGGEIPDELKHLPVEISDELEIPEHLQTKTEKVDRR